ncbi:MAG TPA: glutathione S-transferase family protein [Dongiaceae bacterium]|jgi:glutathione S-transferase
MYTLYWTPGSASIAPHGCLEEAGVPYALKLVDQGKGEHRMPEYLKLNPAGKIPTLIIDNEFLMTESAAMCMLIADRHPQAKLAPEIGDLARGHFYMWLSHLTNTLQPAILRFYYSERYTSAADGAKAVVEKAMEEVTTLWQRIEDHLKAKGPYLLGDRFSAADIFCYMLSTWQDPCPNTYARFPSVKRLADLVSARPAIAKIVKVNEAA